MQQIDIVVYRIMILGVLGVVGYIFGKTGYMPGDTDSFLSKFIVKLTTPALILTTLASYNFTAGTLADGATISSLSIVFLLFALLTGIGVSKLLRLSDAKSRIFRMQSMLGNVGFLGMPLLGEIFGKKGLVYAMFYVIPHDILLWTIGIYIITRNKDGNIKGGLKNLINTNTIAYAIGLVFITVNFQGLVSRYTALDQVYKLLNNAFSPLANITVYLTMLFIGLTLSKIKIGGLSAMLERYPTYVLALMKLIIIPLAAICLVYPVKNFLDPFVRTIVILELAMPCSILVTALADQFGGDLKFATENVFFSTLFTVLTLPAIMYIISIVS